MAVTPLIAVVLLVGSTITAAGVVITFGRVTAVDLTASSQEQIEAALIAKSIKLSLEGASFLPPSLTGGVPEETLEIKIANPTDEPIEIRKIFIVDGNEKEPAELLDTNDNELEVLIIKPGVIETFHIGVGDDVFDWIEIIPESNGVFGVPLKFTPAGFIPDDS